MVALLSVMRREESMVAKPLLSISPSSHSSCSQVRKARFSSVGRMQDT